MWGPSERRVGDEPNPWELFDAMTVGACVVGPDGGIVYANPFFHRLLGYEAPALVGRPVGELDDDPSQVGAAHQPRRYRRADGLPVMAIDNETDILSPEGARLRLRILFDAAPITSGLGDKLAGILERSPIGVSVSRRETGIVVFANRRFAELVGLPVEGIVGTPARALYANPDQHRQVVGLLKAGRPIVDLEIALQPVSGASSWVLFSLTPAVVHGEELNIAWIHDYTERHRDGEVLRELATHDPLTGILNRRSFMECVVDLWGLMPSGGRPIAILVIDVDHFKDINDTYGHAVGDEALRMVAEVCSDTLRRCDIFGRLGGEEFMIALPDTEAEGAFSLAERVRQRIARTPFGPSEAPFNLSVSIGISAEAIRPVSVEKAIHQADQALYQAKRQGRNRSAVFRPDGH
jgi:diguanylate cyclase (GGDEF)-like protein/PAS domain S-box-containing protein